MKKSLYFILPALFAIQASNVNALEIDEKLTLRFLKVSSSKKTVLINRGGEDGLVVGDHAKFFITAGVVARGVSERVSPSRSVWSLYRIVDAEEITQDKVLNLKIASPVKITDDPSRSLKEEAIPGGTETMIMDDAAGTGANEVEEKEVVVTDSDLDEIKDLGAPEEEAKEVVKTKIKKLTGQKANIKEAVVMDETPTYRLNTSKTWELWGMMYINSLSGTTESDQATATTSSTSAAASAIDFSAGIEKYFVNFNNFAKEFSLTGFLHKRAVESGDSIKSKTDWFEYGAGLNYHFYNSAASINRPVGFGSLTIGKGNGSIESKTVINGVGDEIPEDGDSSFFSVGLGAKYILSSGFGARAIFDYFSTTETYNFETTTKTRTLSGPRLQFGLSYRF